jgi:hypothetical protein
MKVSWRRTKQRHGDMGTAPASGTTAVNAPMTRRGIIGWSPFMIMACTAAFVGVLVFDNGPPPAPAPPAAAGGRACKAVDGDTLEISGKRVRLHGIDAPELSQRCRSRDG